jgi:hypothetical protein
MRRSCMRRSVIAVVVVCLFVVGGAFAAPSGELWREKGTDPISKIVRAVKKAVRSLGDAVTTPRP